MSHPLHSWTGQSKDVNAAIIFNNNKNKIIKTAVSVKISSFDSKNANRDSHTMEVTDALKYPNVTFVSKSIVEKNNDNYQVSGLLTFHGITKQISFNTQIYNTKKEIEVRGNFSIKMTAYGIKPPSLLGMPTKDNIKISFNVFFTNK
jgi:polyisoprenoid-binding protein YceI